MLGATLPALWEVREAGKPKTSSYFRKRHVALQASLTIVSQFSYS